MKVGGISFYQNGVAVRLDSQPSYTRHPSRIEGQEAWIYCFGCMSRLLETETIQSTSQQAAELGAKRYLCSSAPSSY